MFKKSVIFLLSCLPFSAIGSEFEFSLGVGFSYAGLGGQLSLKDQDSRYFGSLGLTGGYALGMDTVVSDDRLHSAGFTLGKFDFIFNSEIQYGTITYNYHVDGFDNNGWVFGAEVGIIDESTYTVPFSNEQINPSQRGIVTFDIGYKF